MLVTLLVPLLAYQASRLEFGTTFVETWLPGNDEARSGYRAFRDKFGDDQFLIISWPGCTVSDPRLPQFTKRLRKVAEDHPEFKINGIDDSASMLDSLADETSGISQAEAIRRLSGFGIGKSGVSFVTLKLEQAPVGQRAELFEIIQVEANDVLRNEADELILAGEPYQIHMIDRSSREAMQKLVLPSTIMALFIAWLCLRDLRLTLLVFAFAGLGQLIGMASVSFFLREMIAVLVVLPTLVFMLTLSAAVHLTNYFIDVSQRSREVEPRLFGVRALRIGATPCTLATVTTVFGFGSLIASQLAPVWQFGILSALSLVVSSALTLAVFPAAALLVTIGNARKKHSEATKAESHPVTPVIDISEQQNEPENEKRLGQSVTTFVAWFTSRFATPITIAGISLLCVSLVGLTRLRTSTEFDDMFSEDSDAIKSLNWVRKNIGPISSLEFLVSPQHESTERVDDLVEIELLGFLQSKLRKAENVEGVMSASTFLPPPPTGRGARSTIQRAVYRKKVTSQYAVLEEQGLLHQSDAERIWRLTARVADMRGDNYVVLRDSIVQTLRSGIDEFKTLRPEIEVNFELTGLRTVVEKAHYALITDLCTSFAAAFLLITPVMMLIVRGIRSGLTLMIPNLLPVAVVFGSMGWFGVQLDVASILTASVALGIAVDDTLHFVTWYFRSRRQNMSAKISAAIAIEACARPMLHTTMICACAMFPFFFSDFIPTSKFALLMILILWGAILGDLFLLPAMLQSPFGSWIGRPRKSPETTTVE